MTTRRQFLKDMGMATAGITLGSVGNILANPLTSKEWVSAKQDKVKVAFIGIGNRGEQNAEEIAKTNMVDVVALCDVDMGAKHTQKVMNKFPNAKRFRNFRELFEKYSGQFDAVVASVPDHMHFPIGMTALNYGKHIYLEKPMCRTFHEAELMMENARRHPGVVTQVIKVTLKAIISSSRHGKKRVSSRMSQL